MEKKNFYTNNLRVGTHYYDADMKLATLIGVPPKVTYQIPLIGDIIAPMGFESVYDEFTSELYCQRDLGNFRVRVFMTYDRIDIIDLRTLHTVVSIKGNSLNELENAINAVSKAEDGLISELLDAPVIEAINAFGKQYWQFYSVMEEKYAEYDSHFKKE